MQLARLVVYRHHYRHPPCGLDRLSLSLYLLQLGGRSSNLSLSGLSSAPAWGGVNRTPRTLYTESLHITVSLHTRGMNVVLPENTTLRLLLPAVGWGATKSMDDSH
jgi:hypothetical protein